MSRGGQLPVQPRIGKKKGIDLTSRTMVAIP
jgi:hypothetical protein